MSYILPQELEELKPLNQWIAYRLVWDDKRGKSKKLPFDPRPARMLRLMTPQHGRLTTRLLITPWLMRRVKAF
ncbi:MAG: hypothetical protein IJQ29_04820 [Synergistaceae bacterium]|nr:hypothetical protein [Synergistaceae bacterium]